MLLVCAFCVLLVTCSSCTLSGQSESSMDGITRDEAVRMVQAYFKSQGLDSPGLNDNNLGGAMVGENLIYFEYLPASRALKCSALIYKFHDDAKPGVIEGFKAEEQRMKTDAAGAELEYQPENKGLYLTRTYTEPISETEFARDLTTIMKASEVYGEQVLDRVADKVFKQDK
jgi:hypothetical protein